MGKTSCTTFRGNNKKGEPKYSKKVSYNTVKEAEEWCIKNNLKKWMDKKKGLPVCLSDVFLLVGEWESVENARTYNLQVWASVRVPIEKNTSYEK